LTPAEWTEKIPVAVNENKPVDENDPIMAMYNKQMAVKAMKPKTAVAAVEEENREQTNTAQEY
jgi:hypothetical protein